MIGTQSLESFDYWQLMQDPKKNEEATVARFEANRQQYLKSSVWEEVQEHLWQNHYHRAALTKTPRQLAFFRSRTPPSKQCAFELQGER